MTDRGEIEALVGGFAPPGLPATWTFSGGATPKTPPSGSWALPPGAL